MCKKGKVDRLAGPLKYAHTNLRKMENACEWLNPVSVSVYIERRNLEARCRWSMKPWVIFTSHFPYHPPERRARKKYEARVRVFKPFADLICVCPFTTQNMNLPIAAVAEISAVKVVNLPPGSNPTHPKRTPVHDCA